MLDLDQKRDHQPELFGFGPRYRRCLDYRETQIPHHYWRNRFCTFHNDGLIEAAHYQNFGSPVRKRALDFRPPPEPVVLNATGVKMRIKVGTQEIDVGKMTLHPTDSLRYDLSSAYELRWTRDLRPEPTGRPGPGRRILG